MDSIWELPADLLGALFGHSFVKRLIEVIMAELRKQSSKRYLSSIDLSKYSPEFLELDDMFKQIFVEMEGTYMVRDLIKSVNKVCGEHKIHVCVFISGSNDLTDENKCPVQIAHDLFSIGQYAIYGFGVKEVVFIQAIRRVKCRGMDPQVFSDRVDIFNKKLYELCDSKDSYSRIVSMKGFWRNPDQSVKDVFDFAEDGIHPGSFPNRRGTDVDSASFQKLKQKVRRSFCVGLGHWKARYILGVFR